MIVHCEHEEGRSGKITFDCYFNEMVKKGKAKEWIREAVKASVLKNGFTLCETKDVFNKILNNFI